MSDSFKKLFQEFYCEPLSDYLCQVQKQDEEYQSLVKETEKLEKELLSQLNEAERELIDRLETTLFLRFGFQTDWLYQRAYRDCISLLNWMGVLALEQHAE